MSKILVTGSSGMVGKVFCQKETREVFCFERPKDIRNFQDFEMFKGIGITHVYHLAAQTFVPRSWEEPRSFYEVNTMGTLNVLEFCKSEKASLIYFSTYVYDKPQSEMVDENHSVLPQNPYAHSKYMAEELCRFYSENFAVNILVVRPFNIYGYDQNGSFLIPHIIDQALFSDTINVKDLTPKRDYIFVEDVVEFLTSIKVIKGFDVVNLGSGKSYSVMEVIEVIQKVFEVRKDVVSEQEIRKNEISNIQADIGKMKRIYNWYPKFHLESGIEKMKIYIKNKG